MTILAIWFLFAVATGFVARQKNRDTASWAFAGLLLGPFALLMVVCARTLKLGEGHKSFQFYRGPAPTRICPFCAEDIKPEAIVCKHCGRDVSPGMAEPLINKTYRAIQQEWGSRLTRVVAELELERQGYGREEIKAFLDTMDEFTLT